MGSDFLSWNTLPGDFIPPPTLRLCDSMVTKQKPLVLHTNPFHYCTNEQMLKNIAPFSSQTYLIIPSPLARYSREHHVNQFVCRSNDPRH